MKKCALLTCDDLTGFVTDEHFLEKALTAAGWSFEWVSWSQASVHWDEFDCAIVRTTWDYIENKDLFLESLEQIEKSTCQLFNPFNLIQWNSSKKYLFELQNQGVATIPTQWIKYQGVELLIESFQKFSTDKIIIKPLLGAGATNTFLLNRKSFESRKVELDVLQNQEVMVQPFMERVAAQGEFSVHYFSGELSHGILKKPKVGDFRSQEEFGSHIELIELTEAQKVFCKQVLSKIRGDWLFARVDFIYDELDRETLIELELIEPSLYFRYKEGSAKLLVEKLEDLLI